MCATSGPVMRRHSSTSGWLILTNRRTRNENHPRSLTRTSRQRRKSTLKCARRPGVPSRRWFSQSTGCLALNRALQPRGWLPFFVAGGDVNILMCAALYVSACNSCLFALRMCVCEANATSKMFASGLPGWMDQVSYLILNFSSLLMSVKRWRSKY